MNTLNNKILLGITGSIAAYKTPYLIRELREQGYQVKVVLTQAAKVFVTPMTLQAVADNQVYEELLSAEAEAAMSHISLARWADTVLIAPASAHFIAKLAHGFADDLLSTLCLASTSRIIVAPAMNQQMWLNQATQDNVAKLKQRGILFLGPDSGLQACGEDGPGRMMEPSDIVKNLSALNVEPILKNKKILITAGPTQEKIDPVRYLSNRSSGKMGYALAQAAINLGADVTLISGPTSLPTPQCKKISVTTAHEMLSAVETEIARHDIFISTAAVADYHVPNPVEKKIKKTSALNMTLEPTVDILATVCQRADKPFTIGFAAETHDVLANAENKRIKKGVDMMIMNDVSDTTIGFDSDHNAVTVITENNKITLAKAPKIEIAEQLLKIMNENLS